MNWASHCGIRFSPRVKLSHRIDDQTKRLRGVFVEGRVPRGQLVAVIPERAIVLPRYASHFLTTRFPSLYRGIVTSSTMRRSFSQKQQQQQRKKDMADYEQHMIPRSGSMSDVWFSRDQVLLSCALAMWRIARLHSIHGGVDVGASKTSTTTSRALLGSAAAASRGVTMSWEPFDPYLRLLPRNKPRASHQSRSEMISSSNDNGRPLLDRFATPLDIRGQGSVKLGIPSSSIGDDPSEVIASSNHLATLEDIGLLEHQVQELSSSFCSCVRRVAAKYDDDDAASSSRFDSCGGSSVASATQHSLQKSNHHLEQKIFSAIPWDAVDDSEVRFAFQWAHFMLRSRSMCPRFEPIGETQRQNRSNKNSKSSRSSHSDRFSRTDHTNNNKRQNQIDDDSETRQALDEFYFQESPLLVPFVDMLNHNMTNHNVAVTWNTGASILEGRSGSEEASKPFSGVGGGGGGGGDSSSSLSATVPADREIIVTASRDIDSGEELLMNYADFHERGRFMFSRPLDADDSLMDTVAVDSDGGGGQHHASSSSCEALRQLVSAQRSSGVTEDVQSWLWQFGFAIPDGELSHVRELMWSRSLRGRIRRMMNVRRRGRPGEFVVGVPEGLAQLRKQRARIEADMYRGRPVFPTQAE